MMNQQIETEVLSQHGIRPTAVRILVYRAVCHRSEAFSLADVEEWLPEMDRSSIFRALRLFAEHDILHQIDDGSGIEKYCVCRCTNSRHLNHIHFTCLKCGQTYCLEDYQIPVVALPPGFVMEEAEYVIKGVCWQCNDR